MKLLRAEYNRRAQLRPLLWESTIQLPLEKIYTRLKIVSRRRGVNQGETKRWSDVIWAEDSRRDATSAEARANEANPCDVFAMLKENKDVMTIIEGNPFQELVKQLSVLKLPMTGQIKAALLQVFQSSS